MSDIIEDNGGPVPAVGMTVSVRSRRDVVIVDPERFLAAARQACRELNPGLTEAGAAHAITDVYDAVHALLDRDGQLAADGLTFPGVGYGAPRPGTRDLTRPDGLSPAGWLQRVVLDDPMPLQDYGCILPEDPFAVSRHAASFDEPTTESGRG